MKVLQVRPELARQAFQLSNGLIEKAVEASPETPESLLNLVETGNASLWLIGDVQIRAVCFTQVLQRPKDRVLNILAIGGTGGAGWLRQLRRVLTAYGKSMGATKATMMRVTGHKAYYGLKPIGYCYEDLFE